MEYTTTCFKWRYLTKGGEKGAECCVRSGERLLRHFERGTIHRQIIHEKEPALLVPLVVKRL